MEIWLIKLAEVWEPLEMENFNVILSVTGRFWPYPKVVRVFFYPSFSTLLDEAKTFDSYFFLAWEIILLNFNEKLFEGLKIIFLTCVNYRLQINYRKNSHKFTKDIFKSENLLQLDSWNNLDSEKKSQVSIYRVLESSHNFSKSLKAQKVLSSKRG